MGVNRRDWFGAGLVATAASTCNTFADAVTDDQVR